MSEKTKIAWCDSTLNFWSGCTKVSDGCAHCYAEALSNRFNQSEAKGHQRTKPTFGEWGKGAPRRKSKSAVKDALRFIRMPWICDNCGKPSAEPQPDKALPPCECGVDVGYHRRRIFSLSLGDWLDPEIPAEWLAEMLDTIRRCESVNWILCTKRPELFDERMLAALNSAGGKWGTGACDFIHGWKCGARVPQNVCVLTSVEGPGQTPRIDDLLRIPARWRGLSMEPLLGPVVISPEIWKQLQWAIIGGESGPHARPCNVEWIRSLVAQGKAAGVATFVKQLGAYPTGDMIQANGGLGDRKGGNPSEWPADLRVQQWPEGL